jgi:hypothetical protein
MGNGTFLKRSRISRAVKRAISLGRSKRNYVEDLAVGSEAGLLKLTQRRAWLLPAFVCGVIATVLVWIVALRFPSAASDILSNGFGSNLPSRYSMLLTVLVMLIPFAPPFISLFALGHLLCPLPPESEIARGVMSTFEYTQESHIYCRWNVWGIELHPSTNCHIKRNCEMTLYSLREFIEH